MRVQPVADYVLIRRTPDRQVGHIVIPDTADTKPRIGIVEAVGPGRQGKRGRIPMEAKVGDRVSFALTDRMDGPTGFVAQLPGERWTDAPLLIRDRAILAVLEPDAEASALGSPWPAFVTNLPAPDRY